MTVEYAHIWSCCEQAVGGGVALSSNLLHKAICAPVLVVDSGSGAHAVLYHIPDRTAVQDTLVGPLKGDGISVHSTSL